MKKVKAIIVSIVSVCVIMMTLQLSVFAANSGPLTVYLPKHQGDVAVSTIARGTNYSFFKVNITFIGPGTNMVRAWAENPFGTNLSDPYTQIGVGDNPLTYTTRPSIGTNVTLNMDNPVYLEYLVHVDFSWTPN